MSALAHDVLRRGGGKLKKMKFKIMKVKVKKKMMMIMNIINVIKMVIVQLPE